MATLIRVATVADAGEIARLTDQLGYTPPADIAERLPRILARAGDRFLVAERDGVVLGWVHAVVADYVDVDPFVMIAGLVVDRQHRRQGIGQELLAKAEEFAVESGCSLVRLTSSSTRTAAHRFYEGVGYSNIKTQYSFAKPVHAAGRDKLRGLVPKIDP